MEKKRKTVVLIVFCFITVCLFSCYKICKEKIKWYWPLCTVSLAPVGVLIIRAMKKTNKNSNREIC